MQVSQHFDHNSDPTLAKLLEADAELAVQEADLSAQLKSIQEKRLSLKTVIDMFAPAAPTKAVAAPAPIPTVDTNTNGKLELSTEEQTEPQIDDSETTTTTSAAEEEIEPQIDDSEATPADITKPVAPNNQNHKAQKAPTTANRRRTAKPARATKTNRKAEGWQQYLRDEFSDWALSDAVSAVLQQQPQQVFEIPVVIDAIFVEEIPPTVRNKARDRVLNILSEGVRKNKWYRSRGGSYSMSPVATEHNLAS